MAFCPNCGTELPEGANNCPNCGQAVAGQAAPATSTSNGGAVDVLKKIIEVLFKKKPLLLIGLSLLAAFLSGLAKTLGGAVPLIGISVGLVIDLGLAWILYDGYKEKELRVEGLFDGFKNFWRSLAAMGWREIVLLLWFIVPFGVCALVAYALFQVAFGDLFNTLIMGLMSGRSLNRLGGNMNVSAGLMAFVLVLIIIGLIAGLVCFLMRCYGYALVPYIYREDPERRFTDVSRESVARTKGYKGKIFLTDLLIVLCYAAVVLVLSLLGSIPAIGLVFKFVKNLVTIVFGIASPILFGLVRAIWYDEISCKNE